MPVLKNIRKRNVCEKENVYFQGFWPQVLNICRGGFSRIVNFSEHILPTTCEYSMFLPLTKIKNQNIKVISDKKQALNLKFKSKLVKF